MINRAKLISFSHTLFYQVLSNNSSDSSCCVDFFCYLWNIFSKMTRQHEMSREDVILQNTKMTCEDAWKRWKWHCTKKTKTKQNSFRLQKPKTQWRWIIYIKIYTQDQENGLKYGKIHLKDT